MQAGPEMYHGSHMDAGLPMQSGQFGGSPVVPPSFHPLQQGGGPLQHGPPMTIPPMGVPPLTLPLSNPMQHGGPLQQGPPLPFAPPNTLGGPQLQPVHMSMHPGQGMLSPPLSMQPGPGMPYPPDQLGLSMQPGPLGLSMQPGPLGLSMQPGPLGLTMQPGQFMPSPSGVIDDDSPSPRYDKDRPKYPMLARLQLGLLKAGHQIQEFLLPWVLFTMVMLPIGLLDRPLLGNLSMALCLALTSAFLYLSKGVLWKILSGVCIGAVLCGYVAGSFANVMYIQPFQTYSKNRWYTNVRAAEDPVATKDASSISFSADSFVDYTRGVGFRQGDLYCAAPVVMDEAQTFAGYWAVGKDCCDRRGRFNCGDIWDDSRSTIVVMEESAANSADIAAWRTAVEMSAAVHEVTMSVNPTYVIWTKDPLKYKFSLWLQAADFSYTYVSAAFIFAITSCIGYSLIGIHLVKKGGFPFPLTAETMKFGFTTIKDSHRDAMVGTDFLLNRVCWSGEIIHDYLYFVANHHSFIGVVASCPNNPYRKPERLAVLICVCGLIIFPVSLLTVYLTQDSSARMLLIALCVTLPRNLVKTFFLNRSQQEEEHVLIDEFSKVERGKKAFKVEVAAFSLLILATAILCWISVLKMNAVFGDAMTVETVFWQNSDGIGFAFVLELILDLLIPHAVLASEPGEDRTWLIGFFNLWLHQRSCCEAQVEAGSRKLEIEGMPLNMKSLSSYGAASKVATRRRQMKLNLAEPPAIRSLQQQQQLQQRPSVPTVLDPPSALGAGSHVSSMGGRLSSALLMPPELTQAVQDPRFRRQFM